MTQGIEHDDGKTSIASLEAEICSVEVEPEGGVEAQA